MAEIVQLETRKSRRNQEVVDMLKDWLEMAESGEIHTIAMAGLFDSDSSITAASSADNLAPLLGAVSILQHRMLVKHTS